MPVARASSAAVGRDQIGAGSQGSRKTAPSASTMTRALVGVAEVDQLGVGIVRQHVEGSVGRDGRGSQRVPGEAGGAQAAGPSRRALPAPAGAGAGRSARLATSARSGSSSAAPLSARPPPIRTRSTPVIVTVATIACASAATARAHTAAASGSPADARTAISSAAAGSPGPRGVLPFDRGRRGDHLEAPGAAAPAGRPGRVDRRGAPARRPGRRRAITAPSRSSAPAMPVPTGRNSACRAPRAAPRRVSASSPARTSWPTTVGTPSDRRDRVADRQVPPAEVHRVARRHRAARPPGRGRRRRSRPAGPGGRPAPPWPAGRSPSRARPRRRRRRCPSGSAS